jgi:molybdenum cofactor cytidylyltransferase
VIAGIILAAGASSRMGGPKALLEHRGETFIDRLIRIFSEVCDPVIVVLGYHADVIRPRVRGRVLLVVNPDPERGQLSSLQTALAAVPEDAGGCLFTPVDCPAAEERTVSLVVRRFIEREPSKLLVIPRFEGQRGHPVCAARAIIDEFLAEPAAAQAREVVRRHLAQTEYVDVDDPGILADIDDPEAYRKLVGVNL